jgi:serine/threonine protein kinase
VQVHERSTADGLFPEAKLLDFGLSKMVGEDFGSAAKTFVGTPSYMPPEVTTHMTTPHTNNHILARQHTSNPQCAPGAGVRVILWTQSLLH